MKPVTVALIGLGGYGETYLGALLNDENGDRAKLIAGVEPFPERCSAIGEIKKRGIPVYADLDECFAEHPAELVVVSSPIHLHVPHSLAALSAGSNVLCEKPLAGSLADAEKLAAGRDKAGKFVAIGYQWSFSRAVLRLREAVERGDFGRPLRFKTLVCWPRRESYYARNSWAGKINSNDGKVVLDSPANNATAHYLHNMFFISGSRPGAPAWPAELTAEMYRAKPIENYDTAAVRCVTGDGTEILFFTTHSVRESFGPRSVFTFEEAEVIFDAVEDYRFHIKSRKGSEFEFGSPNETPRMAKLWKSASAVRGDKPPSCLLEDAVAQTACIETMQESCRPVTEFPEHLLRVDNTGGDKLYWVDGLRETLLDCMEKNLLPSEAGVSWARAGDTVEVPRTRLFRE